MVKLVASLDVVGSQPAALEKRHVLVELVVLTGIHRSKALVVGRRGGTAVDLQCERQKAGRGTRLRGAIGRYRRPAQRAHAAGLRIKVYAEGRPANVVIVVEEVSVACGGDDLRSQGDVSAGVVSRVRGRIAEAVRVLRDRTIDPRHRALPDDDPSAVQQASRRIRIRQAYP